MSTFVIVGGVAGGATAATRLRRMDESAEIIMIERGPFVSFANCGLPYHIGGVIEERKSLLVATPEKLASAFRIDVRTRHEVTALHPTHHRITVRDLTTMDEYDLDYDKLLLSPGAKPIVPPLPGVDLEGVHTLRTIPDMDAIIKCLEGDEVKDAVIVGGGFIGLEMAENLIQRGVRVTVVEMLPQVMGILDQEMAALVHRELRRHDVRLGLGDGLQSIGQAESGRLRVTLASGRSTDTDMVVLAIGVRPESDLAREAGLALGPKGHIVVDEHMRTSDPDIYAVGDAIQVTDPVTHRPTAIPLAGPANRQARIAATDMAGRGDMAYKGTLGTAIVKVFSLTVATTGANSRGLSQAEMPFVSTITQSYDHVGYYPGATPQTIKLLYAPSDGRLLGAQVVGMTAVDRTVGTLATAIHGGMTVYDLEDLELPYAPPYGAAKDPVNIAGYVAANRLRGDADWVTWDEVLERDPERTGLLDVRTQLEWDLGHIQGAVHIPQDELRDRLDELEPDRYWILYCAIGQRAYTAERTLKQHGFQVANLAGGYDVYSAVTEKQDNWDDWISPDSKELVLQLPQRADVNALRGEGHRSAGPATYAPAPDADSAPCIELDACGLQCPGPIMAVYKKMQTLQEGQTLCVQATDPGFGRDIAAWAEQTGHTLLDVRQVENRQVARLTKGQTRPELRLSETGALPRAKTLVVFSADLDRALAAFVIANGAASMGQPVTMFFTFWGLNILRRPGPARTKKNMVEKMFGWMMPKGPRALKLSQLNMGGMGTAMIKQVMKAKHVESLESLMASAQDLGVRLVACQMSMDLMGIQESELMDGVDIGGVATYINETDKGNATLFI